MDTILQAAYTELDLLHMERESMEKNAKDDFTDEVYRAGADIRIAVIDQGIQLVQGIIADRLLKMSTGDLFNDINHNLSDKCN